MLRLSNLTAEVGGRTLLHSLSGALNAGDVVGVIGPNGAGKSTLLRILEETQEPAAGHVDRGRASLGTLPQEPPHRGRLGDLYPRAFEARAALGHDAFVEATLALDPDRDASTCSGGEVARLALLDLLAASPDVLLLDEPTNHLDRDATEWLAARLRHASGVVVLVTHDRALLDDVATTLLVFEGGAPTPEWHTGNYATWSVEQAKRRKRQRAEWERQEKRDTRLRAAIQAAESRSRSIETSTQDFYIRKRAAKVARTAVRLKGRMERELERGERVDRPEDRRVGLDGAVKSAQRGARAVIRAAGATFERGGRTLFVADTVIERGDRVALLGPNGSGKTTLLTAIRDRAQPNGGTLDVTPSARVAYLDQHGLDLTPGTTPIALLRSRAPMTEAQAANALHRFLLAPEAIRTPLERLTPGERRRLELAALAASEVDLLLLDEPTNHLDIPGREALEELLDEYEGTLVFATHDRYTVRRLATRALVIEGGRLVEREPQTW